MIRYYPDVATCLNNLGLLALLRGKFRQADLHFRRSLKILEKSLGPDHSSVALTLENYAALMRKTGRDAEADAFEARARDIEAAHPPDDV